MPQTPAEKKYKSKASYHAVETSEEARKMVDRVNAATHIPKRHIVEQALRKALPQMFPQLFQRGRRV